VVVVSLLVIVRNAIDPSYFYYFREVNLLKSLDILLFRFYKFCLLQLIFRVWYGRINVLSSYLGQGCQTLLLYIPDEVMSVELEALVDVEVRDVDPYKDRTPSLILLTATTGSLLLAHPHPDLKSQLLLPPPIIFRQYNKYRDNYYTLHNSLK
jgi:hypothetical protein